MIAAPLLRPRHGVLACLLLLAACQEDVTHADLPSPDGDHHVVVKECPRRGSVFLSGDTSIQVSILPAGISEDCNAFINSVYQFEAYAPAEQLELEWISPTELRTWHPGFDHNSWSGPRSSSGTNPITVTFAPKAPPSDATTD